MTRFFAYLGNTIIPGQKIGFMKVEEAYEWAIAKGYKRNQIEVW